LGVFLAKLAAALLGMGIVLWLAKGEDAAWLGATVWWRVGRISMLVALGVATYFGSLWLLGFRLRDFARKAA
jgi:putative peptidoglycan lipid II flippase